MLRLRTAALVTLVLLGLGSRANADMIFTATLSHQEEVPPTPNRGMSGTATLVLNDAMTALTYTVTVFNIDVTGSQTPDPTDNLVAAHIHAPAPPGVNASIVFGFFGTPFNDNMPFDLVFTPFGGGQVDGTFSGKWDAFEGNNTNLTMQLPNILAGNAHLNFHTQLFPGGEIRGQITPSTAIPEPATLTLLGLGAAGLLGYGWRRKRAR